MGTWIAVAIAAVVLVGCSQGGVLDKMLSHKNPQPVDFLSLTLPDSPNKYLVAPAGATNAKVDEPAPTFAMSERELQAKFVAMLGAEPRIEKLWQSADGLRLQVMQRTPVMRWPDIVDIQFIARDGGGSTLVLYSRSVYGYSDMGVNKARATKWINALK
jgi:uncharacterized protein (DUF1499 family)